MLSTGEIKRQVGVYAADLVQTEMTIGIGTGSTVYWLIKELGTRIKNGLSISVVPTSVETARLCKEIGITLSDLDTVSRLTLTIDGADEIDPLGQLIKGGGGALLQEKIVANASDKLVVIADSSKHVLKLGKFPLPVEVIPFGHKQVRQEIISSGLCKSVLLRLRGGQPFITDHQHYILDCKYEEIDDATSLNTFLHSIPGVVETGLFIGMCDHAIIGHTDGRIEESYF
jgi:ribose 5-phosphate isomerase A